MRKSILSWKQKEWIYDKWCLGYTYVEIADAIGVCVRTVQRAIGGKPKVKPVLEYTENGCEKKAVEKEVSG